jgi:hypothetical protein
MSAVVISLAASPALAESPAPVPQASADTGTITLTTIEVISQELNAAYFGSEALETIPQGENAPLNQVLLQMPGVAQDSFGQIHECAIQDTAWNCRRGFRFLDRRSKPALPPAVRSLPAPCRQQKM